MAWLSFNYQQMTISILDRNSKHTTMIDTITVDTGSYIYSKNNNIEKEDKRKEKPHPQEGK